MKFKFVDGSRNLVKDDAGEIPFIPQILSFSWVTVYVNSVLAFPQVVCGSFLHPNLQHVIQCFDLLIGEMIAGYGANRIAKPSGEMVSKLPSAVEGHDALANEGRCADQVHGVI